MICLIIIHFIFFLLAFSINLLITYFLIKFFNQAKSFWSIFRPILLYEFGIFCFFTIKIDPVLLNYYLGPFLLFSLYLLISIIGPFFIFQYIMQKFSLLDFKKSLLIFLLMFFIITPFCLFSQTVLEFSIVKNLPDFGIWQHYEIERLSQQTFFNPLSEILLEKIDRLNNIFLESGILRELHYYFITR